VRLMSTPLLGGLYGSSTGEMESSHSTSCEGVRSGIEPGRSAGYRMHDSVCDQNAMVLCMALKRMSLLWLFTFRCTTLFLICTKSPSTGKDASELQLQKSSGLLFNLSISIAHLPHPSSHIPAAAPRSSSAILRYLLLILQYYHSPTQTRLQHTALYRTKDRRGSRDSIEAQRKSGVKRIGSTIYTM
jgi:hypothetical protein